MEMREIEKLVDLINSDGRLCFGLRALCSDENYSVGDTARSSYDWDHDADCTTYGTDNEREIGTAAIQVGVCNVPVTANDVREALSRVSIYSGSRIALLAACNCSGGEDAGEIDMQDAQVLAIIEG